MKKIRALLAAAAIVAATALAGCSASAEYRGTVLQVTTASSLGTTYYVFLIKTEDGKTDIYRCDVESSGNQVCPLLLPGNQVTFRASTSIQGTNFMYYTTRVS